MTVLTDIAAVCGTLTIVLIFVAAVARIRWVRWIWTTLVSTPLGNWLARAIRAGAGGFHDEIVAPALERIEGKADAAKFSADEAFKYARAVAEFHGFPPGVDPMDHLAREKKR